MALYRERRDNDNNLIGYENTDTHQHIPINNTDREYKKVLAWIAQGNTADPDPNVLAIAKAEKITEYKEEEVRRIGLEVPGWGSHEVVSIIASIWNMLGPSDAQQTAAKNIYAYVENTAIPAVEVAATLAQVQAIDVANDPGWPV